MLQPLQKSLSILQKAENCNVEQQISSGIDPKLKIHAVIKAYTKFYHNIYISREVAIFMFTGRRKDRVAEPLHNRIWISSKKEWSAHTPWVSMLSIRLSGMSQTQRTHTAQYYLYDQTYSHGRTAGWKWKKKKKEWLLSCLVDMGLSFLISWRKLQN